jgi:hypothetical protein
LRAHLLRAKLEKKNCGCAVVRSATTSQLEPLDVAVSIWLKDYLRNKCEALLIKKKKTSTSRIESNQILTASNLAGWVSAACWNAVGKTAYVKLIYFQNIALVLYIKGIITCFGHNI